MYTLYLFFFCLFFFFTSSLANISKSVFYIYFFIFFVDVVAKKNKGARNITKKSHLNTNFSIANWLEKRSSWPLRSSSTQPWPERIEVCIGVLQYSELAACIITAEAPSRVAYEVRCRNLARELMSLCRRCFAVVVGAMMLGVGLGRRERNTVCTRHPCRVCSRPEWLERSFG